jgi:hypothetical protein
MNRNPTSGTLSDGVFRIGREHGGSWEPGIACRTAMGAPTA